MKIIIKILSLSLMISMNGIISIFAEEKAVMSVLKEEVKSMQVVNITDEEFDLLSKLIAGEARGESYEGQLAVAAVVINRVKDDRFPDSVEDVIYQTNAFSVVKNGKIDIDETDSSLKAAQEALYGKDPTDEAIYFWNPKIATCKWIKKLDPYLTIGNHVFAK